MRDRISLASARLMALLRDYALKFGIVGLVGYGVDVAVFNLLRLGALGEGHALQGPIGAKIASVSLAIVVNWIGNRYWTFRAHRRANRLAEFAEFLAVSLGGMLIGLLCLGVSHYVLGFRSLLADNISGNVIGLVLGSLFRFVLYRYWVWGDHRSSPAASLRRRREVGSPEKTGAAHPRGAIGTPATTVSGDEA